MCTPAFPSYFFIASTNLLHNFTQFISDEFIILIMVLTSTGGGYSLEVRVIGPGVDVPIGL